MPENSVYNSKTICYRSGRATIARHWHINILFNFFFKDNPSVYYRPTHPLTRPFQRLQYGRRWRTVKKVLVCEQDLRNDFFRPFNGIRMIQLKWLPLKEVISSFFSILSSRQPRFFSVFKTNKRKRRKEVRKETKIRKDVEKWRL